jgi:hypothetical protein
VAFRFVSFRFVSFRFVSFRFVSFRLCSLCNNQGSDAALIDIEILSSDSGAPVVEMHGYAAEVMRVVRFHSLSRLSHRSLIAPHTCSRHKRARRIACALREGGCARLAAFRLRLSNHLSLSRSAVVVCVFVS